MHITDGGDEELLDWAVRVPLQKKRFGCSTHTEMPKKINNKVTKICEQREADRFTPTLTNPISTGTFWWWHKRAIMGLHYGWGVLSHNEETT